MRKITGYEAIEAKKENPEIEINKHTDPIENERFDISIDEAREIAGEDSSLVYAFIPETLSP